MKRIGLIAFTTLIVILVSIISVTEYNKHKKPEVDFGTNDEERYEYINDFSEKGITEDEMNVEGINEKNDGGYTGIIIENKSDLLNVLDLDGVLDVDRQLIIGLETLPIIKNDLSQLNDEQTKSYFDKYNKEIEDIYGIRHLDKFNALFNQIITTNDITKASINSSSIQSVGNITYFNFLIENIDYTVTYKIKVVYIQPQKYYVYWEGAEI